MAPIKFSQSLAFPWDYVISLFWDRYPNPFAKHVLTEDVLERCIISDHKLYTKRLIMKQGLGKFPSWLRYFLSGARELVVEESVLDTSSREMNVVTRNVGSLRKYAVVTEYCKYSPTADVKDNTTISRAFVVETKLSPALRSPVTYFLMHHYNTSSKSSLLGYEYVCKTHPLSNAISSITVGRISLTEKLKQATQNRSKEAREFASQKVPRVVRADSHHRNDN